MEYECDYCDNALCPEECGEAKAAQRKWLDSEEFKNIPPLDFVL